MCKVYRTFDLHNVFRVLQSQGQMITLFKQQIMRLIVPALCLVFQVLTFVSAGKIHCLNVSVSKMPENTHELIKK
jgi:hypothetical protein